MGVSKVILSVFTVLALFIIMVILYDVLLVYEPSNPLHTSDGTETHGALWQAAHAIQAPISAYYYNYCFVPNVMQVERLDESMGRQYSYAIYRIPSNLENDDLDPKVSAEPSVPAVANQDFFWSTGWR